MYLILCYIKFLLEPFDLVVDVYSATVKFGFVFFVPVQKKIWKIAGTAFHDGKQLMRQEKGLELV